MSTYYSKLEKLFSLTKGRAINPSLNAIEALCERFDHPELAYPTVHVAGTNGKGSVCTKIATSLSYGGYKVGLYTSPHISSFRERICVNGQMIPEADVEGLLDDIPFPASFFEITTLLAFLYFRKMQVDIAVIETGLGGLWDATNVVLPEVSVITSIGFDHMEILGNTLEAISLEKAGIIKEGVPVILGPDVPTALMQEIAHAKKSPLLQSSKQFSDYDLENSQIARLALQAIQKRFPLSQEALEAGLQAKPACRFEIIQKAVPIVLDVAHNPHGFNRLIEKLKIRFPDARYRFIVGFSKGKDIGACAELLEEIASSIHLVSCAHPRLAATDEIRPFFKNPIVESSIQDAIQSSLKGTEVVVITGSFYIMQQARYALGVQEACDATIWYDPSRLSTSQR